MTSHQEQEQIVSEYAGLKTKYDKLGKMLDSDREYIFSRGLLEKTYRIVGKYLKMAEDRADKDGFSLE